MDKFTVTQKFKAFLAGNPAPFQPVLRGWLSKVQVRAESDLGRVQHFTTDGLPCCFFGGRLKVRSGAEVLVSGGRTPRRKEKLGKSGRAY